VYHQTNEKFTLIISTFQNTNKFCIVLQSWWPGLSQGFIETRSTLKKFFGRHHHVTLPYRVSVVTTMANAICRPWCCCHECVSFLDTT